MTASDSSDDQQLLNRVIDLTVRIGVLVLLVVWCFQITRPFFIIAVWGVIIATALHPAYRHLEALLGGRGKIAAAAFTLFGFALLIAPTVLFAGSLVESGQWLATNLRDGTLAIPPPPEGIAGWPIIGEPLDDMWQLASTNLEEAIRKIGPQLMTVGGALLSTGAGLGLGILQFIASILVSGVLLAGSASGSQVARSVALRLAGARGGEFADLAGATVRSVAQGILGVAIIQAFLIGIGMFAGGIPHAALWTLLCLLLAIVQLPPSLVVIPVVVWVFTTASTFTAVVFTIWMVIAGFSDNVLKPILLGRGLNIPTIIIFVGSIGGFLSSGFIGLFVGAVVLALGYELFRAWLNTGETEAQGAES
jgi:predicted PurR-regulated permease PerM